MPGQEEKATAASSSFSLLRLTDYRPFMPGFSLVPLFAHLNCLNRHPSGSLSVKDTSDPPPIFNSSSLPQCVFPCRSGCSKEVPSPLLTSLWWYRLPVSSIHWRKAGAQTSWSRQNCLPRRQVDEAVWICMLTLQPDRCLSELSIRVTAACRAVC